MSDRQFRSTLLVGEKRDVRVTRVRCELRPLQAITDEEGFHVPVWVQAELLVDGEFSIWPVIDYTGAEPTLGMSYKNMEEWDKDRDEFHRRLGKEVERLKTHDYRNV